MLCFTNLNTNTCGNHTHQVDGQLICPADFWAMDVITAQNQSLVPPLPPWNRVAIGKRVSIARWRSFCCFSMLVHFFKVCLGSPKNLDLQVSSDTLSSPVIGCVEVCEDPNIDSEAGHLIRPIIRMQNWAWNTKYKGNRQFLLKKTGLGISSRDWEYKS